MADSIQFPYQAVQNTQGETALRPMLPISLTYGGNAVQVMGLLDTGADVNVLPYPLGLALEANWLGQKTPLHLSGNLAHYEARGIILTVSIGVLPPARLAFAWTKHETVPLLLGQVNFFAEFDVCFFRSQGMFEVSSRKPQVK
ncbi:MAG: retroviral-like aspartic protease [Anaerolineae bacterium]|nr:retroviral-like aspartic protease [Anaerolineae bacterium]